MRKAPPPPWIGAAVDVERGAAMSAMMPPPVPMVVNYGYLDMGTPVMLVFPLQQPLQWDVMANVWASAAGGRK